LDSETVTVSISQEGVIIAIADGGCTMSGLAYPRTKGNVFDLSLILGGSPCSNPNHTTQGIIYYEKSTKQIYAAAPDSDRKGIIFFVGKR
jgi:hypothetical protein